MSLRTCLIAATVLLTLGVPAETVFGQNQQPVPTWSQEDSLRIGKEIQKRLAGLTNYGVFDWMTFGDQGKTVVLRGFASRPTLKSDAENAVKSIPGVERVDNQIEVLPNSPNDDRMCGRLSTTGFIRRQLCGSTTRMRVRWRERWDRAGGAWRSWPAELRTSRRLDTTRSTSS